MLERHPRPGKVLGVPGKRLIRARCRRVRVRPARRLSRATRRHGQQQSTEEVADAHA